MTSKADEIKARTARVKAHQSKQAEEAAVKPGPSQKPRTEFVRRSLDLPPAHHDALTMWCAETARELGRARLNGSDVLRALVKRLLTDETFARSIRRDLAADHDNK